MNIAIPVPGIPQSVALYSAVTRYLVRALAIVILRQSFLSIRLVTAVEKKTRSPHCEMRAETNTVP